MMKFIKLIDFKKRKKRSHVEWIQAQDINKSIRKIVKKLKFWHIDCQRIITFRSHGSTTRARARIWSFPRIWQMALSLPPHYIIEVISKNFDKLESNDQIRVLIHELLHIPKNFSGSLVPHRTRSSRIDTRRVETLFKQWKED